MNSDATKLVVLGLAMVAIGLSGWVLPHKWNLLRVRGSLGRRLPEGTQRAIPRVVGTLAILGGLLTVLLAAAVGIDWMGIFRDDVRRHQQQMSRQAEAADSITVEVQEHDVQSDHLQVRGLLRNHGRWRVAGVSVRVDLKSAGGDVVAQDWEEVVPEGDSFSPGDERTFEISTEVDSRFDRFDCVVERSTLTVLEGPAPAPRGDSQ
jgi:hypothetical protein